jgi:lactate dehydrogenase-like 2-hydroxyacid dehydrogenase
MKHVILQNGPLSPWLEEQLAASYQVLPLHKQPDLATFLHEQGTSIEGIATSGRAGASGGLIDALPNLRVISSFGVGHDAIDVERAHARGIQVGYTPDVLNDCVADTAFALLMDVARGISASDRFVRRGDWLKGNFPLTTRVSGKRLGIVGLGRIGHVIARRAAGFDMEVRYHNRRPVEGVNFTYEPKLTGLATWCDFLVVIAAGGAGTRHLVDGDVLRALGPQGFLVNVARGSVIDEQALVKALQDRSIAGAGLDVFDDEPNVPPALFTLDNVVLLPHVASATNETRRAMAELTLSNLDAFFATGTVPVAVPGQA